MVKDFNFKKFFTFGSLIWGPPVWGVPPQIKGCSAGAPYIAVPAPLSVPGPPVEMLYKHPPATNRRPPTPPCRPRPWMSAARVRGGAPPASVWRSAARVRGGRFAAPRPRLQPPAPGEVNPSPPPSHSPAATRLPLPPLRPCAHSDGEEARRRRLSC